METGQMVLIECRISRSAFSGERVFRLVQEAGRGEHLGVAPVGYCRREDRSPLRPDEPAGDEEILGLVEARVVSNGGDVADVETPDGEVVRVRLAAIPYTRRRETSYAPLGS